VLVWSFERLGGRLSVKFDIWHEILRTMMVSCLQVFSVRRASSPFGTDSAYVRKIVMKRSLINDRNSCTSVEVPDYQHNTWASLLTIWQGHFPGMNNCCHRPDKHFEVPYVLSSSEIS